MNLYYFCEIGVELDKEEKILGFFEKILDCKLCLYSILQIRKNCKEVMQSDNQGSGTGTGRTKSDSALL